jgi:hypothetical protein
VKVCADIYNKETLINLKTFEANETDWLHRWIQEDFHGFGRALQVQWLSLHCKILWLHNYICKNYE